MDLPLLPTVNALLNAVAATLLVLGRRFARRREIPAHRRTMLTAFGVSSLFLLLYVYDKASRGFESQSFNVEGTARTAYLGMLATHVVLAAIVPFLALRLIYLGLQDRRPEHRRLARITWPIWIYVSLTGVLIYALLYLANPHPA